MNENEKNVLDELCKGACMGKDAIAFTLEKVNDKALKEELTKQYQDYDSVYKRIKKIYPDYSDDSPHETSTMNKVMTWYGIEIRLLVDESSSKIAELILQGTNMGIIEGRRLLNHKDTPKDITSLLREYVDMQEKAVENLKKFL